MKITEEYLSKNIEINKTYFYNELKNYILNINKEEIKTLINKDKEEYKNNQLEEAVNLLTFYENNNVDFSNERLVEKYNLLYSYNQDISQIKLRVKEIEKNIDNVGKENKNTQTYKNLSEKLKEQNNDDENIRVITEIQNALNEKKYGLVWEEHSEKVDEMLEHNIPIFSEAEERRIIVDENLPYNFLLEGDNLHSLKLLEKTHKGKIDVIYIDPPYNRGKKDFKYNDDYIVVAVQNAVAI